MLAFLFQLLNFSISIIIYRIIKVKEFTVRKIVLNLLVYKPLLRLARRLNKDLLIYNSRWKYYFTPTDSSSYNIMMLSHEGDVPIILFKVLKNREKAIFIDVGAHQGAYTLAFSPYCSLIIAIEAHPRNYEMLERNLKTNKVNNVLAINCAITSHEGKVILYSSQFSDLHTIHPLRIKTSKEKIEVPAYSLDTLLLEKLNLEKVDVLKIDVEGAEVEVLRGMNKILDKLKPILVVEVFSKNLERVNNLLKTHNYRYEIIYESVGPITNEKYFYLLAKPLS